MPISDAQLSAFVAQLISDDRVQAEKAHNGMYQFLEEIMSDVDYDSVEVMRRLERNLVHQIHTKYNFIRDWFIGDSGFIMFQKGLDSKVEAVVGQWGTRVRKMLSNIYDDHRLKQALAGNRKSRFPYGQGL